MAANNIPRTVYWLGNKLYLNITNQCSNNCWFCFRNFKKGVGDFHLILTQEPSINEITIELHQALNLRSWNEAVFCGFGEPTTRLDVLLTVTRWLRTHLPTVPIRLDTNGHGYALNKGREVAKELKVAGITKSSVSLNGDNQETYNENCRPKISEAYAAALEFIKKAKVEFEVEITAVRLPEVDIRKVNAVADKLGVPFRARDYIPCFW